jgi:hypothetical protein
MPGERRINMVITGILLLSCADALLTLGLLELGGRELNAFMAMLIYIDVQLFVALKMGFTGASLIFLVIHQHFRVFRCVRVDHVLRAVLLIYLLLDGYELMLMQPAHAPMPAVVIVLLGVTLAAMGLYLDRKRAKLTTPARVD